MDELVDDTFTWDIRRTLILGRYIAAWGLPRLRVVASKPTHSPVEVYEFPGDKVCRIATVGLSAQSVKNTHLDSELLFVLPADYGGETFQRSSNYLVDVMAHILKHGASTIAIGRTWPAGSRAPSAWPRAMLFDEPRGEPESLEEIRVGAQTVRLLWAVPIHGSEEAFIRQRGIEAFDALCEAREESLVDVRRAAFCS